MARVCIVGAGAAGLGCALELVARGEEVVLLDAAPSPGGKLGTLREDGFLYERAAVGLLDRDGILGPLCERLGVRPIPARAEATTRWAVRDGAVHALPSGMGSLIGTGVLTAREKWGLFGEPWRRARTDAGPESVRDFFARRLGAGGAFLGTLLQTGIYAGDATQLEAESAFPQLVRWERERGSLIKGAMADGKARKRAGRARAHLSSFAGGMQELVDALGRAVGSAFRPSTAVRSIERMGTQWRVRTEASGQAGEVLCDQLVLALPAPALAALLGPLDSELPAQLGALQAAPITLVHLGVQLSDLTRRLDGFGILGPGRPVVGSLFPSSLWPGRAPDGCALISTLVGGAVHPEAARLPDPELLALVRRELLLTVGLAETATPRLQRIVRWEQAIPQPTLGHRTRVQEIDGRVGRLPGLQVAGSWLHGVSVLDCLKDGQRIASSLLSGT